MYPTKNQLLVNSARHGYGEITTEEPPPKTAQSTVTLVYQSSIAGYYRSVTVLWIKNYMNYSLVLMVDGLESNLQYTTKIDLKPWHFWGRRGYKSLTVEERKVNVYWDLRSAKFVGNSPEPSADYYIALVSDEEVVLLLGDFKNKAYKRTKARPSSVEPVLFYKKENVFAKKNFTSRARFNDQCKEHHIMVEASTPELKDPEMWIGVDGVILVHIKSLHWKFRGNQTVLVDKQPVQVLWDVHDWLFQEQAPSNGLFIFKPVATEAERDQEGSGHGGDSDTSTGSSYDLAKCGSTAPDFCLLLYAWKLD